MSGATSSPGKLEPTILVVDDEESFVTSLAHALKREGYRVLTAGTGPTGLELALEEQPDVVLLDLMLPGMPGLEVCRAIRAVGGPDQPGIIMVTAKSSDVDAVVGLESGADDYVAKPFNLSLLLARIRALLRRNPHRRDQAAAALAGGPDFERLQLGELLVDEGAYVASWAGRPLDLSPRLFALLLYLARRPGRVVTRDDLLNDVWGYDYAGQTRTVDVHVHWLRELLDAAGASSQLIQTVRGVGYKLVPPGG